MRFEFDKKNWQTIEEGEKDCFLLTNGLGGYCSLSVIGAAARGDHALFMSAKKAPNIRWHMITNVFEKVTIDGQEHILTSQRMKSGNDYIGFQYLEKFVYDDFDEGAPAWIFQIEDVCIRKSILMVHGENVVALHYQIENPSAKKVQLEVIPLLRFTSKKESFNRNINMDSVIIGRYHFDGVQEYSGITSKEYCHAACIVLRNAESNIFNGDDIKNNKVYVVSNAKIYTQKPHLFGEMYFSQDERDGREMYGDALINHSIIYQFEEDETKTKNDMYVIFSTKPSEKISFATIDKTYNYLVQKEKSRREQLLKKTELSSDLGRQLVLSADAYIVERSVYDENTPPLVSTDTTMDNAKRNTTIGKSIIAGYPYFEDWGRDTMISLAGTTMVTGRFDECKCILQTFAKYVKNGLLPNLFPEGGEKPMYNSADAPLLFINAIYEYMEFSKDYRFKEEMLFVMEQIISSYQNGTDFHIKMDSDGLIMAGAGLEQLTWMDVRVGDFLPTPRHGKPVEINAYWYSALMIMDKLTGNAAYKNLADKVKHSFLEKFWNEKEQCLKDVLSGGKDENQVRCNQIWALTMPFTMLELEKEALVIKKVKDELYTTIGLRTLSKKDTDFHEIYIGKMEERDRAYHQGTVWAFPLGAYYRACIRYARKCEDIAVNVKAKNTKVENDSSFSGITEKENIVKELKAGFEALKLWLAEGCVAQIAEIYDGGTPTVSRGCFAQAWSVGELLRAVYDFEKMKL